MTPKEKAEKLMGYYYYYINHTKTEDKKEDLVLSEDSVSVNYADSVEIALVKTKDIDVDIKQKINQVEVLSHENKDLKVELKNTKLLKSPCKLYFPM